MAADRESGLAGLRVLALESRRATEIGELIRRHGGEPVVAPSMREVPLEDNPAAFAYVDALQHGHLDATIFLTGVGTRALVAAVASRCPAVEFAALLQRHSLIARGPKPVAALRELGLTPTVIVPEPNTWRDILTTLDRALPVAGRRVAIQEYGISNPELVAGLRERGAKVTQVPVYRWALPQDTGPLRAAVAAMIAGEIDILLCTSATQVYHLFQIAAEAVPDIDRFRRAFARVLIASIGPICSDGLRAHGLVPDLEPEHPKMGQLVGTVARQGASLLVAKRKQPLDGPTALT